MDRTVEINGVELYFSVTDIDFMKKFRAKEESFIKKLGNMNSDDDLQLLEMQYNAGCEFFDSIFGKGTSGKVFKKKDIGLVLEAYKDLVDAAEIQTNEHLALASVFVPSAVEEASEE